jgi:hypothetical protein
MTEVHCTYIGKGQNKIHLKIHKEVSKKEAVVGREEKKE